MDDLEEIWKLRAYIPDPTTPPVLYRNSDAKDVGGYIKYNATIGFNFESALDSLLKVIIFRPNEPYIVVSEPLDVEYPTNDREFYWIAFKDTADWLYLGSPTDVLDTKGDWYKNIWGKD